MHRLSLVQALAVWSELEAAYHGKNGFGSDTAEIYMHTLMPRSPSAEEAWRRGEGKGCTVFDTAAKELVQDANEALLSLLRHFAKTRKVHIEVNGKELGDWLKTADFDHRVHVKVIRV